MRPLSRAILPVSLLAAFLFSVTYALFVYYRPTLEFSYGEPLGWLAFAIVLPVAVSAAIAFLPQLRDNPRQAAGACLSVGLADFALSFAHSPSLDREQIALAWLFSFVPMTALFAVSRLPTSKQFPWTLVFVGPIAYWVTAFAAVFIWIAGTPFPQ